MKKYFFIICIISAFNIPVFATDIDKRNLYGTWRFPSTEVYVVILESNDALQCRIATDFTIITAIGKVINGKAIEWKPIIAKSQDGEEVNFSPSGEIPSWGKDQLILDNDELTLEGKFGSFTFVKYEKGMNSQCEEWFKIAYTSLKHGTPELDAP